MRQTNQYDRTSEKFEAAVKLLRKNLQYLADQDKVSPKFIALHNGIIRTLIDFQHHTNSRISDLEMDVIQLMMKKPIFFQELHDTIEALEAICLIHGIIDFPAWMAKGKSYLVHEAINLHSQKTIQVPTLLLRSLSSENQHKFHRLFNPKTKC